MKLPHSWSSDPISSACLELRRITQELSSLLVLLLGTHRCVQLFQHVAKVRSYRLFFGRFNKTVVRNSDSTVRRLFDFRDHPVHVREVWLE